MITNSYTSGHSAQVDDVQHAHPQGPVLQRGDVGDIREARGEDRQVSSGQRARERCRVDNVLQRPSWN